MTLVLVSLSTILLAGFARHSLRLALAATRARDDLQRRWAFETCRRSVLLQADQIFESRANTIKGDLVPWPQPAALATTIRLGDMQVSMVLADEDAKLDVNQVYEDPHARPKLASMIQHLSPPVSALPLQLRPFADRSISPQPSFSSWGQVFDLTLHESGLSKTAAQKHERQGASALPLIFLTGQHEGLGKLMQGTRELTCWGSGRLNVARASDQTLETVVKRVEGDEVAQAILEQRRSTGQINLNQTSQLRSLLTDRSECYSLWVELTSDFGQSYAFSVVDEMNTPKCTLLW